MIKKATRFLTPFQWFEVLAVTGPAIYFAVSDTTREWWYLTLTSLSAICGIFCVVLCAAGKKAQYYWGFVNIAAYIAVSWVNRYYGEVMLNALYYLPTQFVGMYVWGRHYSTADDRVITMKMSGRAAAALLAASGLAIWGYRSVLAALGGNAAWLDSASTSFSLIANALMVLRYREQWIIWIVVDAITVVMWILAGDLIQVTMWTVYLINAFYGLIIWSKGHRPEQSEQQVPAA